MTSLTGKNDIFHLSINTLYYLVFRGQRGQEVTRIMSKNNLHNKNLYFLQALNLIRQRIIKHGE